MIAGRVIFLGDIAAAVTICNHHYYFCWPLIFPCLDPEHQRAKGNLKYFEFQLEKQKKAEKDEPKKEKERVKREPSKKKSSSNKKMTVPHLPERKKYEMLCRGEGIRMVRKTISYTSTQFPT